MALQHRVRNDARKASLRVVTTKLPDCVGKFYGLVVCDLNVHLMLLFS